MDIAKMMAALPTFLWRPSAITKKARRPMFILYKKQNEFT